MSHKGTYIFVTLGTFVNVRARNASKAVPWGTRRRKIRSGFFGTGLLCNKTLEEITERKEPIVLVFWACVFITDDIFRQLTLKWTAGVFVGPGRRRTFLRAERSRASHFHVYNTLEDKQRAFTHGKFYLSITILLEGQQSYLHYYGWVSWGSGKVKKSPDIRGRAAFTFDPGVLTAWQCLELTREI